MEASSLVKYVLLGAKLLPELVPAVLKFKEAFSQAGNKSVSVDEFKATIEAIEQGHSDVVDAVSGVFDTDGIAPGA